MRRDKERWRRK